MRTVLQSFVLLAVCAGCGGGATRTETADATTDPTTDAATPYGCPAGTTATLGNLVPLPVAVTVDGGLFCLPATAAIEVDPPTPELLAVGQYLAAHLRPATGFALEVRGATTPQPGNIRLTTVTEPGLGEEGYGLTVSAGGVTVSAAQPAGLMRGIQTLRQLLPAAIEAATPQPGPWPLATGSVTDQPRFAWRGVMLDVARHFFSVADVKHFIDEVAYYKINRFHVHLTDDQGWRLAITSWPQLSAIGGSTEVGGATGKFFYSQAEFADIVAYAAARYITVVPEMDMPGHSNAALASYAELNCDHTATALYTGTNVGFSSLCIDASPTAQFVSDALGEVAALTPGMWLHIGGDEAKSTSAADYAAFMQTLQPLVAASGKMLIGWAEIAHTPLKAGAIVQHWNPYDTTSVQLAVQQHAKVILSPANRAYLDMKYDGDTPLGLVWAGLVDEQQAYAWDPATELSGVGESDILGVEAALWTETIATIADIEVMAFPRLAGLAEVGWSPAGSNDWASYRLRIAAHGPRLTTKGVGFYRSTRIPWQ